MLKDSLTKMLLLEMIVTCALALELASGEEILEIVSKLEMAKGFYGLTLQPRVELYTSEVH